MLNRSQLKAIFDKYGFRPLKRLGENYLIDRNIRDKIVAEARVGAGDTVLEIGPGLGALTEALAASGAAVVAVEKDRKAFAAARDLLGSCAGLTIVHCDILKFDISSVPRAGKVKIVGNLPYYITTPIVEYIVRNKGLISSAVITVQREVANRLLAAPGSGDYGSISCFVRYHTRPSYIHTISPGAFYPEPEVESSVIRLDVPDEPTVSVKDEGTFFRVIRGAFNQRRKSVSNSLAAPSALDMPKDKIAAMLDGAGIDRRARPETLSLEDFARIADRVSG